jgi:plastocyanin
MDSHGADQGDHGESHGIHMPDPSLWPLVVGLATFVAGAALIWWSHQRDNDFAGPLLGVALAFVLLSAAGWAWEDGRMRKKAEEGAAHAGRQPRYNQVITFAIAEGQLAQARSSEGVLSAIERAELRDLEGFEDLRITVSPAAEGPSQVLVETTWRGREGLDTYEGTRQTLLDIVTAHDGEVLPGTVQVFDMEVVRDTKDTSFRFSMGAAATVVLALVLGGFALGGALTAFESDAAAGGGGGGDGEPTTPADPFAVSAFDGPFRFSTGELRAAPNVAVTFTLSNRGTAAHNLSFYTDSSGATPLADGSKMAQFVNGGQSGEVTFTTPAAGSYFYRCDLHPNDMTGTFVVEEGGPGGAPAPAGETPAAEGTATG